MDAAPPLSARIADRLLPRLADVAFPDAWLAAGDDRARLLDVARQRRRLDGAFPAALLKRSWQMDRVEVAGRPLHLLTGAAGTTGRLLFYVHGGAYVLGPSGGEILMAAAFARRLGADLALYDYAKVPEVDASTIVPAVAEAWRAATAARDPARVVLSGNSAGGGLAAGLAVRLGRDGDPLPGALFLVSPWLDLASSHPDVDAAAENCRLLRIDVLRRDGELYAGERDVTDPELSPRYAADDELARLPRTIATCGANELFRPEVTEFVDRINAAGGDAHLLVEPHGQHSGALAPTPTAKPLVTRITIALDDWLG